MVWRLRVRRSVAMPAALGREGVRHTHTHSQTHTHTNIHRQTHTHTQTHMLFLMDNTTQNKSNPANDATSFSHTLNASYVYHTRTHTHTHTMS